MKTPRKVLLFAVLLAAAAAGFAVYHLTSGNQAAEAAAIYYCPMHPSYTSDRAGTCPICNMSLVKKDEAEEAHVHDHAEHAGHDGEDEAAAPRAMTVEEIMNMKPGEVCLLHKCKMGKCMIAMTEEFARLGKCPHCGEDLGVTVLNAMPEGYTQVKLSPEKQQVIGVKTAEVKKAPLSKVIRTAGRIAYDPELYQAQEEYLQALAAAKKAEGAAPEIAGQAARLVESARIKLRLLGLGDELVGELETSGRADRTLLYGDAGGTVWLYAPVYEYELPFVKSGDRIKVEVPALPGKNFEGVIRSMDPVLDPVTRSVRVRAQLENPEGLLKPEMYVNAVISNDLGERLVVPEEAVFSTGDRHIVFVARGGAFEPREVTPGASAEGLREVKEGLKEGESVVISGNFLIDSESRLKASLEGMSGGAGGHQHG